MHKQVTFRIRLRYNGRQLLHTAELAPCLTSLCWMISFASIDIIIIMIMFLTPTSQQNKVRRKEGNEDRKRYREEKESRKKKEEKKIERK